MPVSTVPKVIKDGIITLYGYDSTGLVDINIEIECDPGDFSITPGVREPIKILDRGEPCAEREGALSDGSLSFSYSMKEFTNVLAGTPIDFIEATAGTPYEDVVAPQPYETRYLGDIRGVRYQALSAAGDDAVYSTDVQCDAVRLTWSFGEGDPDIVNVTGATLIEVTRAANATDPDIIV